MNDFEVDLSKIFGDFVETKEEVDEYSKTLERLTSHCRRTWICVPYIVNNTVYLEIEELEECSSSLFEKWVHLIYPPVINSTYKLSDLNILENKINIWSLIINSKCTKIFKV